MFGGGAMSSSDGQRFPVRGKSLTAREMVVHGGQVLSSYTHVSDQHSTFGTKVIVPTAREAHYMLDDFLGNATDLPVYEHATDTHGVVVTWTPLVLLAPPVPGFDPLGGGGRAEYLEVYVRVLHQRGDEGSHRVNLLDDGGEPIAVVSGFLLFLAARDCSPNTLVSYAYDLRHLWRFFNRDGLAWEEFAPRHSIALLEYFCGRCLLAGPGSGWH